jgi:hypothetical protein
MAIVVAQDGSVQFIACHNGAPTYWARMPASGAEI